MDFPIGDTPRPCGAGVHRVELDSPSNITAPDQIAFAEESASTDSIGRRFWESAAAAERCAGVELSLFAIQLSSSARDIRGVICDRLQTVGLHEIEFLVLCSLAAYDKRTMSQRELVEQLPFSAARISRATEALRRSDWVTVERDDRDRRRQSLKLTSAGGRQIDNALVAIRPILKQANAAEDRIQIAQWTSELSQLRQAITKPIRIEESGAGEHHQDLALYDATLDAEERREREQPTPTHHLRREDAA